MSFEEWSEVNEEELTCIFAETGRDRETYFDREEDEIFIYEHPEVYRRQFNLIWEESLC